MTDDITAPFLDKTDWRITIHRKLEACLDAMGTAYFPLRVKSLVSAVSAPFPGWDAEVEMKKEIDRLELIYNYTYEKWVAENPTARRWLKYKYKKNLYHSMCNDIFDYIKSMCARKRMLLWGSKKLPGGSDSDMED